MAVQSSAFTTRPVLTGTFGMVASTHWLASQAGMAVLERGGNAFDAAVAAGFVLQVVEPEMNGPGGEVPLVAWDAREQRPFVVCGQGSAPAAADIATFRELGLDLVPGTGQLPACVPGSFGAWMLLLQRYGTLGPADVLRYAIEYAGAGFPIGRSAVSVIARVAPWFREHWPSSASLWLNGDTPPTPGGRFINHELAQTYQRIADEATAASHDRDEQIEHARRSFYEGFVAEAVAKFAATEVMDESGRAHRGLLSHDDLAAWRSTVEEPISFDYHGRTVYKAGPWSQAPVFLQQLALLEGFDLASMDPSGPEFVHTVVECAKLAFADREAFYGDPAFADVPLDALLSREYAERRRTLIGDAADVGDLRPGSPGGREPRLPAARPVPDSFGETWVGEPTLGPVKGDTCHLDVVDRHGNVVSATPSGGWLHGAPTIPGLGFCLGTRAQMFWLDEGLPNSLAPGKRPRTTLTPSLAVADGEITAFGTPGGDQQDQWSLLWFLRRVHHGMDMQEAIDAPSWHTTHFTSSFYPRSAFLGRVHVEARIGEATVRALRERGHDVVVEGEWSLGRLSAASRAGDGLLRAAANPRGMQGYAVGR
ncbi:gamma-glutamyltransferase family protein [Phytoactinopolyspora halotolerans]|uniref:Gamma-glutamyltransferase family protein n=1 Tax=Phytoactinopolyspora halotolerans TaxID=1981512 RepID=A0A6L9S8I9_9ACTN|nr:gamma-glutamyltransferase family protein [Phytoactinopolyspora halotolerans]NEE01379.1 gamma-glutamyltransferase family protein [Phytoactinopolyspora halotolerans]